MVAEAVALEVAAEADLEVAVVAALAVAEAAAVEVVEAIEAADAVASLQIPSSLPIREASRNTKAQRSPSEGGLVLTECQMGGRLIGVV